MKKLLLVFGNEYVKQDSLAIEISKEIGEDIEEGNINPPFDVQETQNVSKDAQEPIVLDIKRCYSVGSLYDYQDYENIFILDVVKGLENTTLITDIDKIKSHKLYSLHDFDLGFFLKLMKELGMLKEIKIIGIPQEGDKEEIKKDVLKLLE